MLYQSSRGVEQKTFDQIVVDGLAPDGGLYSPVSLPSRKDVGEAGLVDGLVQASSVKQAIKGLFSLFTPEWPGESDLDDLINQAYVDFRDPKLATIEMASDRLSLLNLTQGPTFAFKDFALCLLGPLPVSYTHLTLPTKA